MPWSLHTSTRAARQQLKLRSAPCSARTWMRGPVLQQTARNAPLLRAHMDARIEAEAAKLDPADEQRLADEGLDDYTTLVGEEGTF